MTDNNLEQKNPIHEALTKTRWFKCDDLNERALMPGSDAWVEAVENEIASLLAPQTAPDKNSLIDEREWLNILIRYLINPYAIGFSDFLEQVKVIVKDRVSTIEHRLDVINESEVTESVAPQTAPTDEEWLVKAKRHELKTLLGREPRPVDYAIWIAATREQRVADYIKHQDDLIATHERLRDHYESRVAAAVKARDEETLSLLSIWNKSICRNTFKTKHERFGMLADLIEQRIKYLEARIGEKEDC